MPSRALSCGRVRSADEVRRVTDRPRPTQGGSATRTPPSLHAVAGESRLYAPCSASHAAATTTDAADPLPPNREHDSREAPSTPHPTGACTSTDPTTTALRYTSAPPGGPSPPTRTDRSTRSTLRGSRNEMTPPTTDAPHRTTDVHRSAVHDGSPSRSRRDTTAPSHRARLHGSRRTSASIARTPLDRPPCGRGDIAHGAGRPSPLAREPDEEAPQRLPDRDGRDYARPHPQRSHRAAGPPRVACDPGAPPPLPVCDRDRRSASQIVGFCCASLRTSARPFSLRSAISRAAAYLPC